eukprot:2427219-Pleurochrysis_carterae.AAC.3
MRGRKVSSAAQLALRLCLQHTKRACAGAVHKRRERIMAGMHAKQCEGACDGICLNVRRARVRKINDGSRSQNYAIFRSRWRYR